jgi:flagellar basal body-associated protein FliL
MEKNLLIIMVLVFIVLLIFAVGYRVTAVISKSAGAQLPVKTEPAPKLRQEKQVPPANEYRNIIESTKNDYENFMGKNRPQ